MAKTTPQEYLDRGFTQEMFRKKTALEMTAFLSGIIAEQAGLLTGRVGAGIYTATDALQVTAVTRAERLWVLAELLVIRIDVVLGNVDNDDGDDMLKLRRNREAYLAEAETLINRLTANFTTTGSDYAGAVVECEHTGALVFP